MASGKSKVLVCDEVQLQPVFGQARDPQRRTSTLAGRVSVERPSDR
jgi:hypothetical protein